MPAAYENQGQQGSSDRDRVQNANHRTNPRDTDAILGGNTPPPIHSVVLGGTEGIKRRWESDNLDAKIAALQEVLKSRDTGLKLLCQNSKDEFLLVRLIASYALEHNKGDSTFEQLLQDYPLWQPVRTLIAPIPATDLYQDAWLELSDCILSPDKRFLLCHGKTLDDNPHLPDYKRPSKDEFCYILDLKSGHSVGNGSRSIAANLECRTSVPSWPDDYILRFNYVMYNWSHRKNNVIRIFSPERKLTSWGFQKENSPSRSWSSLKTILSPDSQTLFLTLEEKVLIIDIAIDGESRNRIDVNLDVETDRLKHSLTGNSNLVENLALTPDGRTLATCDRNGNFFIWDLQTLALRHTFTGNSGPVNLMVLSPDGKILASSSQNRLIFIWDIESGTLKHTLTFPQFSLISLAISPDGQILASQSDNNSLFWHIPSGELLNIGPGGLLSHDFQMLIKRGTFKPQDPPRDLQGCPLEVWEAEEFISFNEEEDASSTTEIPAAAATVSNTQSQAITEAEQTTDESLIAHSSTPTYAEEIISGPKRDSRWVYSTATDLDEQLLGCKIIVYKIQWFSGTWSNWCIPGINDLYQKTNLGESVRRVWACFNDHRHQYLAIPLSEKSSLRSFTEFDRGLIPPLPGDSGVKFFEGQPTHDNRWATTLSLNIDREITGRQIIAY